MNGRAFITQPEDQKVEAMLVRIDERMAWMREDAQERKEQMETMFRALRQLEHATATLKTAMEALMKDVQATAAQEKRLRALEEQCAVWRPAMTRWQKIHDAFVITVVKWVLGAALAGAAAAAAISKVANK